MHIKKKEIEEQYQKEKALQQQMLMDGISILEDEMGALGIPVSKNQNIIVMVWNKFLEVLVEILDRLTPHRSRLMQIEREFTKAIQSYFKTYRFLNMLSVTNIFVYFVLFINQNLRNNPEGIKESWESIDHKKMCGIVPCFCLYSGFDKKLGTQFSLHLFLQIFFVSTACMLNWAKNDYIDLRYSLY